MPNALTPRQTQRLAFAILAALPIMLTPVNGALGGYWLHFDSPTNTLIAYEATNGCWGTASAKPLAALLLAPVLGLLGPAPETELYVYALLGAVLLVSMAGLVHRLTGSFSWGLATALGMLALPGIQYTMHIHMVYPAAFLALGLWMAVDSRPFLAGIMLGAAITSHSNFLVPVGLFGVLTVVAAPLDSESIPVDEGWNLEEAFRRRWRLAAAMLSGLLCVVVAIEVQRFWWDGSFGGWTQDIVRDILRQYNTPFPPNVLLLFSYFRTTDGLLGMVALSSALAWPLVRSGHRPTWTDVLWLAGVGMFGYFTLRAFHGQAIMGRMLTGLYLLLLPVFAVGMSRLANTIRSADIKRAFTVLLLVLIVTTLGQTTLTTMMSARSAYPQVEKAFARAAEADLPVEYRGNFWAGLYFARVYGVEVQTNRPLGGGSVNPQAVIILDNADNPGYDPALYDIQSFGHRVRWLPAETTHFVDAESLRALGDERRRLPVPTALEIWWPRNAKSDFVPLPSVTNVTSYYSGEGCTSSKPYGDGTLSFGQLLLYKAAERLGPR